MKMFDIASIIEVGLGGRYMMPTNVIKILMLLLLYYTDQGYDHMADF